MSHAAGRGEDEPVQVHDVRLGTAGYLPSGTGDYKVSMRQEDYKQTVIDPRVRSNANMPLSSMRLPEAKRQLADDFPSEHSKRSQIKLEPLEQRRFKVRPVAGGTQQRDLVVRDAGVQKIGEGHVSVEHGCSCCSCMFLGLPQSSNFLFCSNESFQSVERRPVSTSSYLTESVNRHRDADNSILHQYLKAKEGDASKPWNKPNWPGPKVRINLMGVNNLWAYNLGSGNGVQSSSRPCKWQRTSG